MVAAGLRRPAAGIVRRGPRQGLAGIGVGDTIWVNVLGRDVDLKIASLRSIAWQSLAINFFMVASPGLLSHAPHTHIATVRVDPAHEAALLRTVTDGLPNVTGIRVSDVLTAVSALLDQVANALAATTAALTLPAGLLVLVSAVSAGQARRIRDLSIILRTLGATGRQIRAAWLVEFGLVGLAAGLVSILRLPAWRQLRGRALYFATIRN